MSCFFVTIRVGKYRDANCGGRKTSEVVLEGLKTMNQRWMKRRIERSRARSTTDKHELGQIEHSYGGCREVSKSSRLTSGLTPKLSRSPTSISVARK